MITADQLKDVMERTEALHHYLNIDKKRVEFEEEQLRTQAPDFWEDQKYAEEQMKKVKTLEKWIKGYENVKRLADELQLAFDFHKDELVTEEEVDDDYAKAVSAIEDLELMNMLRQKEDPMDCVMKINSGAGGTESQDWAQMLMRMYIRYGEKKGWKVDVDDYLAGDEAGLKSCSIRFTGYNAYGHLRAEKGVHRLVRISPFDSSKRRHTSFASVEVSPELDDDIEITIDPKDLRIDTYRASGAGGQHINKTDSAVRITHIPTNIVVSCQSQRSQLQNREQAMLMLKSKLYLLMQEAHAEKLSEIQGEKKNIEWGSQIRSYVLHPYSMVKDNRSGYESNDPKKILDGDLDDLIYAYLRSQVKEKNNE